MYLFFDTETTGLPRSWKAPITDVGNWPRMVQLAYIVTDDAGNILQTTDRIIRPDGFTIPTDASRIHGITTEKALKEGISGVEVLQEFEAALQNAQYLVAHNINFDEKVVGAELLRNEMSIAALLAIRKLCTMQVGTNLCRIPSQYGYKFPKLEELHRFLFRTNFEGAHNAATDIAITAKCFWEMRKRGVI